MGAVVAVAIGGALIEPAPGGGLRAGGGGAGADRRSHADRQPPPALWASARRRADAGPRRVPRRAWRCGARGRARSCSPRRCGSSPTRRCRPSSCSTPRTASGSGSRQRRRAAAGLRRAHRRRHGGWPDAPGPSGSAPLLMAGAALLGGGLLAAAPASSLAAAAPAFAAAALGAGLRHRARLPLLRPLRARGRGGPLQRRVLRRPRRGGGRRAAAGRPGGRAERQLPRPCSGSARRRWSRRSSRWLLAERARAAGRHARAQLRAPGRPRVAAVIPVFASDRAVEVARAALEHVDELVLVEDGAPCEIARSLDVLAGDERVRILRLAANSGKGSAVAAGSAVLLAEARPPEAIVVLDSDGQHDPERIPAFLDAAREADVVIGDRRDRARCRSAGAIGNRAASLACSPPPAPGCPTRRTACASSARRSLRDVPLPRVATTPRAGTCARCWPPGSSVASVEIPTIYDGEPSHFARTRHRSRRRARWSAAAPDRERAGSRRRGRRARASSARGGRGSAPRSSRRSRSGAAMPVFQPLDNALFLTINGLGDGPEWLYQALDPHTRNYILLTAATVIAAALACAGRATCSAPRSASCWPPTSRARHRAGQAVRRARPSGGGARRAGPALARPQLGPPGLLPVRPPDRDRCHGHGRGGRGAGPAPAADRLRGAWSALTRVLFGAHFPLDVLVGAVLGYEFGLFAARLMASARLLPAVQPSEATTAMPLPSRASP